MSEYTPKDTGKKRPTCAPRRATRAVMVGGVQIGGGAPVAVQSMTCTRTPDVEGTLAQIRELAAAGRFREVTAGASTI